MKIIFVILYVFLFIPYGICESRKSEIFVILKKNDCNGCLDNLKYLNSINKNVKKIGVFDSEDSSNFFEKFQFLRNSFDSLIDRSKCNLNSKLTNTITSKVLFFFNGELIFNAPLKKISFYVDSINYHYVFSLDSIFLPKKVSGFSKFDYCNNFFVFYNSFNHSLKLVNFSDLKNVVNLNLDLKLLDKIYYKHYGDLNNLKETKAFYDRLNMTVPFFISNYYLKNDTLFLFVRTEYPKYSAKYNDTIINEPLFSMIKFHNGKILDIWPIKINEINNEYSIQDFEDFHINGDRFYFRIIKNDYSFENVKNKSESYLDSLKFLICYRLDNESLIEDGILKWGIPNTHRRNSLGYNMLNARNHNDYYINMFSNQLYNLKTKTIEDLNLPYKFNYEKFSMNEEFQVATYISDFYFESDFIYFLIFNMNKYYNVKYSLKDKVPISKDLVQIPDYRDQAIYPLFYNKEKVLYISSKNNYLHLIHL